MRMKAIHKHLHWMSSIDFHFRLCLLDDAAAFQIWLIQSLIIVETNIDSRESSRHFTVWYLILIMQSESYKEQSQITVHEGCGNKERQGHIVSKAPSTESLFPTCFQISRLRASRTSIYLHSMKSILLTYSAAIENRMPINVDESFSVYISIPEPLK